MTGLPRDITCSCGRPRSAAGRVVYRTHADRFYFRRCECGQEWTERERDVDPLDPVTSEEVVEVHQRLAKLEGGLTDLLGQ
jgi:hypothetical protein